MPLVSAISFRYRSGDDVLIEITVTLNDVPLALTGATPRFRLARLEGDEAIVSTDAATAVITVTDEEYGVYEVKIEGDVTATLAGTYYWESDLLDFFDDVQTVARGYMTFSPALSVTT